MFSYYHESDSKYVLSILKVLATIAMILGSKSSVAQAENGFIKMAAPAPVTVAINCRLDQSF